MIDSVNQLFVYPWKISHIPRPCHVKVCNSNVGGGLFNLVTSSDVYALSGHGRSSIFLYGSGAASLNLRNIPSYHIAPNV